MPFTNKRFIAILGILPFPIIKHISVNSQRTGYLWGFLALFGNHFNRLNLKRLVKPLHFDAFPNHWTPPILRAGFYANTNSSLCPLFRGKIIALESAGIAHKQTTYERKISPNKSKRPYSKPL